MSRELDYFPPRGTKYTWSHKALQHLPWVLDMWDYWPASITARVSKKNGIFIWWVEVRTFTNKLKTFEGISTTDLAACLAAEKCCEEQKKKIWLPWMNEAAAAGWRPPA